MEENILSKCQCGGDVKIYDALYQCENCKVQVWKYSYKREFKDKEGKLELIFDEDTKSTIMFLCECGGEVTQISQGYKCTSCEKIIWEKFMNKLLTFKQIKRLFKGDGLKLNNLKSQRGNIFNAEIFYVNNELNLEYI